MAGGIPDELDALTEGLSDFDFVLSSLAEVEWLAWNATVVEQCHDLHLLSLFCWIVNIVHKLLLKLIRFLESFM